MNRIAFAALLGCSIFVLTALGQTTPSPAVPAPAPAAAAASSNGLLSQIPSDTGSIILGAVAALGLAILHMRGNNMPVLSSILAALSGAASSPTTPNSSTPAVIPQTPNNPPQPLTVGHGLILQQAIQAMQTLTTSLPQILEAMQKLAGPTTAPPAAAS